MDGKILCKCHGELNNWLKSRNTTLNNNTLFDVSGLGIFETCFFEPTSLFWIGSSLFFFFVPLLLRFTLRLTHWRLHCGRGVYLVPNSEVLAALLNLVLFLLKDFWHQFWSHIDSGLMFFQVKWNRFLFHVVSGDFSPSSGCSSAKWCTWLVSYLHVGFQIHSDSIRNIYFC